MGWISRSQRAAAWGGGAAFLAALVATSPARAHDLWLEPGPPGYTLRYGHLPSGHDGARGIEYDPATVLRADCFDASGRPLAAAIERASPVTIRGDCAALFVLTSSGTWTKTPYGTLNVPKDQAEQVVESWRSFESVKWLETWGQPLASPVTGDLEITPLANPFTLRDGDKLQVLVTRERRPVAGAVVSYDGKPRGTTDRSGTINVRVRHGDVQRVTATLRVPIHTPQADVEIHTTSLSFELGGGS